MELHELMSKLNLTVRWSQDRDVEIIKALIAKRFGDRDHHFVTANLHNRYLLVVNSEQEVVAMTGLNKSGYIVKNSDFLKIGIPFTLAAVIPAYIYIWTLYGGL